MLAKTPVRIHAVLYSKKERPIAITRIGNAEALSHQAHIVYEGIFRESLPSTTRTARIPRLPTIPSEAKQHTDHVPPDRTPPTPRGHSQIHRHRSTGPGMPGSLVETSKHTAKRKRYNCTCIPVQRGCPAIPQTLWNSLPHITVHRQPAETPHHQHPWAQTNPNTPL